MWRWFGKVSVRCDKIDMTFPQPRQTPRNFKMKNSISSKYFHAKMLNSIIVLLPRRGNRRQPLTVSIFVFSFQPSNAALSTGKTKKNSMKMSGNFFDLKIKSTNMLANKKIHLNVPQSRSWIFESWNNNSLILKFIFILFLPRYKANSYIEVKRHLMTFFLHVCFFPFLRKFLIKMNFLRKVLVIGRLSLIFLNLLNSYKTKFLHL